MSGELEAHALEALNKIREGASVISARVADGKRSLDKAHQDIEDAELTLVAAVIEIDAATKELDEYNARTSARRAALRLIIGDTP